MISPNAHATTLVEVTQTEMKGTLPPFALLVEEHGTELLRHARRLAGADAEDVLQSALLKALRSYARLTNGDNLRGWLFRVVTTTAFDHVGRTSAVPFDSVPESSVEPELYDDAFESLLEGLSDASRAVLELRFVEDLPYAQIADQLEITPEAARQRVASALRGLRKRLA